MVTKGKKLSFTGYALFYPSSNFDSFVFSQKIRVEYQKQDIANKQALLFSLQRKTPKLQDLLQWSKNERETLQEELVEIQKQLNIAEQAVCKPHEKEEQARIVERIRGYEQKHQGRITHRESRINQYSNELKQIKLQLNKLRHSILQKQKVLSSLESALEKTQQELALKQKTLADLKSRQQADAINADSALIVVEGERRTFGNS